MTRLSYTEAIKR